MFNRVDSVIIIWFDYTRLMYNIVPFWNKSLCYMYCRVYNTLNKQSRFWLGTIRELVADLTTINASISSMTFVELVFGKICLSLAPRVAAFRAWCSFLVLYFLSELYDFKELLKSAFASLRCPQFNLLPKAPLLPLPPKLVWQRWLVWPIPPWGRLYDGIGIGAIPLF